MRGLLLNYCQLNDDDSNLEASGSGSEEESASDSREKASGNARPDKGAEKSPRSQDDIQQLQEAFRSRKRARFAYD